MVDTDSKSAVCKYVPVRVRPSAPLEITGRRGIGGRSFLFGFSQKGCNRVAMGTKRHTTKQRHPIFYHFFEGKVGNGGIVFHVPYNGSGKYVLFQGRFDE